MAVDIQTTTATIANGASLSGAVTLYGRRLLGFITPAAMTGGGNFTLQGSVDGTNFFELNDNAGALTVQTIATSTFYAIPETWALSGLAAIKIRTGTSSVAINQGAARDLTVIVR